MICIKPLGHRNYKCIREFLIVLPNLDIIAPSKDYGACSDTPLTIHIKFIDKEKKVVMKVYDNTKSRPRLLKTIVVKLGDYQYVLERYLKRIGVL